MICMWVCAKVLISATDHRFLIFSTAALPYTGKRAVVVGAGPSGTICAMLLAEKGFDVQVCVLQQQYIWTLKTNNYDHQLHVLKEYDCELYAHQYTQSSLMVTSNPTGVVLRMM